MNFPSLSPFLLRASLALGALLACRTQAALTQWTPFADTILTGGQIVTVDEQFSFAQAIAIKDGRIIAVGTADDVLKNRGPETSVIPLGGRVVVPGLQDSHLHFQNLGYDANYQIELGFANTSQDLLNAIKAFLGRNKPQPGAVITGERWDQYKYRMVTRAQLDEVAPAVPLRLWRTYRGLAVNTAFFNHAGIYDDRPDTWPKWWLKDPPEFTPEDRILREKRKVILEGKEVEMEVPNGVFLGRNGETLFGPRRELGDLRKDAESVRMGCEELLKYGVTSVVDPASRMGYMMKVYQEAYNRGFLKVRVSGVYEGIFFTESPEWIREHFEGIKINNLGDDWLRWRGVKFYADGGSGTRSAWVSEPFQGEPDNFGLPVMRDNAQREAQYRAVVDQGWDLHTHTCGDYAMRQAVDLYKKLMDEVRTRNPQADLRWSLIHAYLPLEAKTRVLEDMARYKIIACINPIFNWQEAAAHVANLGEERMARFQPARSYLKAGVKLVSGSDYTNATYDPWRGIYALLTRREQVTGRVYGADETIGVADALRTYTINGAYLTHEENFKGSLEVGKVADLVVIDLQDIHELDRNPDLGLAMAPRILLTLVNGKVGYQNPAAVAALGSISQSSPAN